jgi:TonB family protein
MATVTTSEFVKMREPIASFSMIEHKGIFTRLFEEGSLAIGDFTRDPRGFLREIFSDETKDAQRSKRLRMGLVFGLAFQLVAITAIAIAGWHHATTSNGTEEPELEVKIYDFGKTPPPTDTLKESSTKGATPGKTPDVAKGSPDAGSQSGGGQQNPLPAQQGVLPQQIPIPAIISPTVPNSQNPSLPVNPTIEGPLSLPPPPGAQIGLPNGGPNNKSAGPGTGGGIGNTGEGTGIGNNKGPGGGSNPDGGGTGGGDKKGTPGLPNGTTPAGSYVFGPFSQIPGNTMIKWLRRATPVVTPEAQTKKVNGVVLLRATFNADGTITDIEIVNPVDDMTESAIDSLKRSKFSPATVNGTPVTLRRVLVYIKVNTELH